jgi:hypothetical protein
MQVEQESIIIQIPGITDLSLKGLFFVSVNYLNAIENTAAI